MFPMDLLFAPNTPSGDFFLVLFSFSIFGFLLTDIRDFVENFPREKKVSSLERIRREIFARDIFKNG